MKMKKDIKPPPFYQSLPWLLVVEPAPKQREGIGCQYFFIGRHHVRTILLDSCRWHFRFVHGVIKHENSKDCSILIPSVQLEIIAGRM